MRVAIPPLPHYVSMAWPLVKHKAVRRRLRACLQEIFKLFLWFLPVRYITVPTLEAT